MDRAWLHRDAHGFMQGLHRHNISWVYLHMGRYQTHVHVHVDGYMCKHITCRIEHIAHARFHAHGYMHMQGSTHACDDIDTCGHMHMSGSHVTYHTSQSG